MPPKRSTAAWTAASASSRAGDVELDDQQVVGVADGLGDGVGVAAGGHDVVAGGERGLGDLDAHAAAGAGDEPGLLLGGHGIQQSADLEKVGVPVERGTGRVPQPREPGLRWPRGDEEGDPRVPHLPPRPDHARAGGADDLRRRRVPGLRREEVAVLAGVSVPYYTRLERGDMSGASESVLEALARALQLDDAERAHLFDLARAAQPPGRARAGARPSRASGPRSSGRSTRSPAPPRTWATTASTSWPPTSSDARCSPSSTPHPRGRPNHARFVFLDPRAEDVLRRLGPRRPRDRRDPALGRRPRPVRPRPLRPRRRARHPERGVPHPLGRPQRPLPRHRASSTSTTPSSASSA